MDDAIVNKVKSNPKFQELVRKKTSFGWLLSALMICIYFGFILLVAFNKAFLAQSLSGGVTTVGIPLGVGVIVSAFVLTGIYVAKANSEFDELNRQIVEESK